MHIDRPDLIQVDKRKRFDKKWLLAIPAVIIAIILLSLPVKADTWVKHGDSWILYIDNGFDDIKEGPVNAAAEEAKQPELNQYQNLLSEMTPEEADLLRRVMYGECHAEPFEGRVAAVQVVLNRVLSPEWPNTIMDVLKQGNGKQFNAYRSRNKAKPDEAEDDAISYLADGGKGFISSEYVYFSRGKSNGKGFIRIGKHWFSK